MDRSIMDSRVRELEIKLTFLEKRLEEVEAGALMHFRQLERMERDMCRLAAVASRLAASAGEGAGDAFPGDERPPHY